MSILLHLQTQKCACLMAASSDLTELPAAATVTADVERDARRSVSNHGTRRECEALRLRADLILPTGWKVDPKRQSMSLS